MPPSAAPEWLRVGCSFEMTPTFAPASCASMAARMPAQPAPTTSTSCFASMSVQAIECNHSSVPIQPLIEGTSADQRASLVEIIDGLGPTEITRIEVRRYLPRGEDDV